MGAEGGKGEKPGSSEADQIGIAHTVNTGTKGRKPGFCHVVLLAELFCCGFCCSDRTISERNGSPESFCFASFDSGDPAGTFVIGGAVVTHQSGRAGTGNVGAGPMKRKGSHGREAKGKPDRSD